MAENAPFLPGLSPVDGKPVHITFDAGRLTSDAGVLLLAEVERRLGLAERLARCLADPRAPERVRHTLAEMIRFRMLLIAAGLEIVWAIGLKYTGGFTRLWPSVGTILAMAASMSDSSSISDLA